jgi:hypothetical protein
MSIELFRQSSQVSLIVQIITGIVAAQAIFIKLPAEHQILTTVITLETVVQVIEFIFYIWVTQTTMDVASITSRRYIDWAITTPTMLLTTIFYFKYLQNQASGSGVILTARDVLSQNTSSIAITLAANWLMLAAGVLGELGITPLMPSNAIGFVFFAITFYQIYQFSGSPGHYLFMFLLTVWSLYGIVAMFPTVWKNIGYNILDIIAKNFYGIYIWLQIRKVAAANQGIDSTSPR